MTLSQVFLLLTGEEGDSIDMNDAIERIKEYQRRNSIKKAAR